MRVVRSSVWVAWVFVTFLGKKVHPLAEDGMSCILVRYRCNSLYRHLWSECSATKSVAEYTTRKLVFQSIKLTVSGIAVPLVDLKLLISYYISLSLHDKSRSCRNIPEFS